MFTLELRILSDSIRFSFSDILCEQEIFHEIIVTTFFNVDPKMFEMIALSSLVQLK